MKWPWLTSETTLHFYYSSKYPLCHIFIVTAMNVFRLLFTSLRDVKQSLTGYLISMYLYQSFLTNFGALYLTQFLTDFGQILDSKSYDQA